LTGDTSLRDDAVPDDPTGMGLGTPAEAPGFLSRDAMLLVLLLGSGHRFSLERIRGARIPGDDENLAGRIVHLDLAGVAARSVVSVLEYIAKGSLSSRGPCDLGADLAAYVFGCFSPMAGPFTELRP
jgi:hypothetical protein